MFGNTISMMEKSMDYLWKKQEVTANNIANVDTPGYRRKRVNFEETFRRKLEAAALTGKNEDVRQAIQSSKSYVVEDAHTTRAEMGTASMPMWNIRNLQEQHCSISI